MTRVVHKEIYKDLGVLFSFDFKLIYSSPAGFHPGKIYRAPRFSLSSFSFHFVRLD